MKHSFNYLGLKMYLTFEHFVESSCAAELFTSQVFIGIYLTNSNKMQYTLRESGLVVSDITYSLSLGPS